VGSALSRSERTRLAALLAALCLLLAGLVQLGALNSIDQWGADNLAPLRAGPDGRGRAAPLRIVGETLESLREPAAPGITLLIVAGAWLYLRRDGRGRTANAFAIAFALALAAEVILKLLVDQNAPGIPRETTAIGTISHGSFPSGHMTRTILLTGLATVLWPEHRRWFVRWMLVIAVGIALTAMHLLSDIAGGAMLGTALLLVVLNVADSDRRGGLGWRERPRRGRRTPASAARQAPAFVEPRR
jgi:membrane-associated phospholipid phosphatase